MSHDQRILRAEQEIAKVLQDLEADTGCLVENLEIIDVDATRLDDERQRIVKTVRIHLFQLPDHEWQTWWEGR